jgi:hypothetical protein
VDLGTERRGHDRKWETHRRRGWGADGWEAPMWPKPWILDRRHSALCRRCCVQGSDPQGRTQFL